MRRGRPTEHPVWSSFAIAEVEDFYAGPLGISTSMPLMGDEMRRTQRGNNNADRQNTRPVGWDWELLVRPRIFAASRSSSFCCAGMALGRSMDPT